MVDEGRARGRAETWRPWLPPWAAGGSGPASRPAWAWPDGLARGAAQRIRDWIAVEVGPGRLVPWLAIAFGLGIVIYFTIDREPASWAATMLLAATVAAAILVRHRPIGFPLALGAAAMAAGFATVTIKRAVIAHPVLSAPVWNVEIGGFVEAREERERSDRITVRVERISGPRLNEQLERVRVSVRKGTAPAVGSFVEFKARLSPPLEPLRPGGYDFARDMYFQRMGASGFVLGRIRTAEAPHEPTLRLRYAMVMDGMREGIDKRIRAVLPGDKGAIASALITGKRDAISAPVNEAMYTSSLAHVLSISGYHMAVVAGIMFFVIRALFALMPAFANRHPIKKWAAVAALCAAAFYLLLSGAEVATQRSFIMIAIVLIGVMVDRPTLTFRTLTVAAFGVLLLAARGGDPSELPDVVCGDAGARRRLPARPALDEPGRRHRACCAHCVVGRAGDPGPAAGLAARRHRDHSLHRLSFPPHLALWRGREPAGDAGRVRLGDAVGHSRRRHHAARPRRLLLADDGPWHRMDDRGRGLGLELSRSIGTHGGVRHRPAAAVQPWPRGALPAQDPIAVRRIAS